MLSINAISLAPSVEEWLANSRQPRILHIFDRACNLINEHREVLSIVTTQIGNGPFNLVLADDIRFSTALKIESPIVISSDQLILGALNVNLVNTRLWNPCPDWARLRTRKAHLFRQLSQLPVTNDSVQSLTTDFTNNTDLRSPLFALSASLVHADLSSARKLAAQLAGLGIGLTPAGDDILLGAMYATWIIHPPEVADVLVTELVNTAAPLTTSLSAAWLKSAGVGEAGILWHRFFDKLIAGRSAGATDLQAAFQNILSVGETSGADALSGFLSTFTGWASLLDPQIQ